MFGGCWWIRDDPVLLGHQPGEPWSCSRGSPPSGGTEGSTAAGCLERLLLPSWPALGSPAASPHCRKHGAAMSPASTSPASMPPATRSTAARSTPLPSWLMSYCFSRSKNSLGKFPEHKVSLRSWKAAVQSCLRRAEKDKRRKDGKGAKERSRDRSGKKKHTSSLSPVPPQLGPRTTVTTSASSLPRSAGKSN